MPYDDQRDIEEPQPGAVYSSVVARRSLRRRQAVVGVTGLVIILGATGVAAQYLLSDDPATVTDAGVLTSPLDTTTTTAPAEAPGSSVVPSVDGRARAAARRTLSPRPSVAASSPAPASTLARQHAASPSPSTTAEQIKTAREQAAKDGFPVQRPLPARSVTVPDGEITVTTTGSLRTDKRTLKVVSARGDLTGHRELGLVADGGEPVGPAHCSQTFRVSPDAPAMRRPTLLVCWRTSANRSVYTVAVDLSGHPSTQASVAQIDRVWQTLG